jgi:uncharacterized OsmC-like protein
MTSLAQSQSSAVNGVDVGRLMQTVEHIRSDATLARFQFRLSNRWLDGAQTRSTVRDFFGAGQEHSHTAPFTLTADEPPLLLGGDRSANPGELLLHALAACVTSAIAYHAAARGITIRRIESAVEGNVDLRGFLGLDPSIRNGFENIRMHFRIDAEVPDKEFQALCDLGPQFSPVYDSLTRGLPVQVSAERLR